MPKKKGNGNGRDVQSFEVLLRMDKRLEELTKLGRATNERLDASNQRLDRIEDNLLNIRQLLVNVTLDHDKRIRELDTRVTTLEERGR